ncbi:MAG TPA: hypothetical protein VK989_03040, partial [Polyangia bacterium]|nr:hypothetical protein [Polyangia bacterium]
MTVARVVVLVVLLAPTAASAKSKGAKASPGKPGANATGCEDGPNATIWLSPETPVAGAPVAVFAVADGGAAGELAVTGPDGRRATLAAARRGTAPLSLSAELTSPRAGRTRFVWTRGDHVVACR